MKTILLPTDFSATAKHAAQYAIAFAKQIGVQKIVFYHSYQAPVLADPSIPSVQLLDMEGLREAGAVGLQNFIKAFSEELAPFTIETINEFSVLSASINEICNQCNADVVVMGVTGASALEQTLIGSTAISVMRNCTRPVIIVPPKANFSPIKEVVLACDLKNVVDTTPVEAISKLLELTKAKLYVLNLDQNGASKDSNTPNEAHSLFVLFKKFSPELHLMNTEDEMSAIDQFVNEHKIDLIITIPKKHGFFDRLFSTSFTKKLAYHSHIALMAVHD